jgi:adenylate kinase family enzyme
MACVVVLCGAPGAGKSKLSRELARHVPCHVGAVHHISFDDIERAAVRQVHRPRVPSAGSQNH